MRSGKIEASQIDRLCFLLEMNDDMRLGKTEGMIQIDRLCFCGDG